MRMTATAVAALFALTAAPAMATGVKKAISNVDLENNLQGQIEVNLDKNFDIEGTAGLDLTNVEVIVDGTVDVEVPASVDNALEFQQGNWGDVTARKDFFSRGVTDVEVSSTAIANVVAIEVPGSLALEGAQINDGNITARADVTVIGAETVDVTATAIANAVTATVGGDVIVDLSQSNEGNVFAQTEVDVWGVGEINTAATAIGNVVALEIDGNAIGSIDQMNKGNITALNSDSINARFDPATATAIANAISITQTIAE